MSVLATGMVLSDGKDYLESYRTEDNPPLTVEDLLTFFESVHIVKSTNGPPTENCLNTALESAARTVYEHSPRPGNVTVFLRGLEQTINEILPEDEPPVEEDDPRAVGFAVQLFIGLNGLAEAEEEMIRHRQRLEIGPMRRDLQVSYVGMKTRMFASDGEHAVTLTPKNRPAFAWFLGATMEAYAHGIYPEISSSNLSRKSGLPQKDFQYLLGKRLRPTGIVKVTGNGYILQIPFEEALKLLLSHGDYELSSPSNIWSEHDLLPQHEMSIFLPILDWLKIHETFNLGHDIGKVEGFPDRSENYLRTMISGLARTGDSPLAKLKQGVYILNPDQIECIRKIEAARTVDYQIVVKEVIPGVIDPQELGGEFIIGSSDETLVCTIDTWQKSGFKIRRLPRRLNAEQMRTVAEILETELVMGGLYPTVGNENTPVYYGSIPHAFSLRRLLSSLQWMRIQPTELFKILHERPEPEPVFQSLDEALEYHDDVSDHEDPTIIKVKRRLLRQVFGKEADRVSVAKTIPYREIKDVFDAHAIDLAKEEEMAEMEEASLPDGRTVKVDEKVVEFIRSVVESQLRAAVGQIETSGSLPPVWMRPIVASRMHSVLRLKKRKAKPVYRTLEHFGLVETAPTGDSHVHLTSTGALTTALSFNEKVRVSLSRYHGDHQIEILLGHIAHIVEKMLGETNPEDVESLHVLYLQRIKTELSDALA